MNTQVRLARQMVIEAMLIGVMLARDDDASTVLEAMDPKDMTSVTGRQLLESIKDGNRKRFAKIMSRRYGVRVKDDERAVQAILRTVQLRNAAESLRSMSAAIAEQVRNHDSLGDVAEQWEEGLDVLRRVLKLESELGDPNE